MYFSTCIPFQGNAILFQGNAILFQANHTVFHMSWHSYSNDFTAMYVVRYFTK